MYIVHCPVYNVFLHNTTVVNILPIFCQQASTDKTKNLSGRTVLVPLQGRQSPTMMRKQQEYDY